jgi:hypothetical protein
MTNIQKTLDSLQPYVIGIRYYKGMPVVDMVLKENWVTIPDSCINTIKGEKDANYWILYTECDGFGIDEILNYAKKVIEFNQEKEKKAELLREKVMQLKELFNKNSLNTLLKLRFTFDEDIFLQDNVADEEENIILPTPNPVPNEPISEEEREILEEEARGEMNRKILATRKKNTTRKVSNNIELPPRKEMVDDI